MQQMPDQRTDQEGIEQPKREGRRRWSDQAWRWAGTGRSREAVALQRALVAGPPGFPMLQRLRDRFRLLRWELSQGSWMEARELITSIETDLIAQDLTRGSILPWLQLAGCMVQFQLGEGPHARRILAAAVRRTGLAPGRVLRLSAYRLAWLQARLAREPGAEEPASYRKWNHLLALWKEDLPARVQADMLRPGAPLEVDAKWLERAARAPVLGRWRFSWDDLAALIQGPAEAAFLRAASDRLCPARQGSSGAPERGAEVAALLESGDSSPSPRPWLFSWLECAESKPPSSGPAWLVSMVAGQVEEWVPEICVADRGRCHKALSALADRVKEPWARAAVLESLAETSLWLAQNGHPETPAWPTLEAALAGARHDLALAAGLLGRMGWKERAAACERRWARLTWPVLGPSLAGPQPHRSAQSDRPRPNLNWIRWSLADAGFITGDARVLRDLTPLVLLAPTPLPVLILGESGTGKEVIARAIHRWSQLRGEFVPIHCGAIPRELLESELFGHTRGAFTGAAADKAGLVEAANGGSLFLDEIGEMGREAQMKMV